MSIIILIGNTIVSKSLRSIGICTDDPHWDTSRNGHESTVLRCSFFAVGVTQDKQLLWAIFEAIIVKLSARTERKIAVVASEADPF